MSTSHAKDPYTAKASSTATPDQKLAEVRKIVSSSKFAMLTTRDPSGQLHSRAMSPACEKALVFNFLANQDSGKFDSLANDPHVNLSFSDESSTNWLSVAGKAKVVTDLATIKDCWSPAIRAWVGDLGDGVHEGTPEDPRVVVIQVVPSEIRYWIRTTTAIGQAYEVAKGALTGETAAPGALRLINASELESARKMAEVKA